MRSLILCPLWILLGAFPVVSWSWSRQGFIDSVLADYSKFDQAANADTVKDGVITDSEFTNSLYRQADVSGNNDNKVSRAEFIDLYTQRFNISSELATVLFDILNDPKSNDDIITSADVSLSSFSGRNYATVSQFRDGLEKWLKQSADKLYTILMSPHVISTKQEPEIMYSVIINSADTNNDDVITVEEINEELKRINPTQSVRRRDWVWRNNQRYGADPVTANLVFDYWDRNRDLELSLRDVQELKNIIDINGNNKVERDEFLRFVERGYKLSKRMTASPLSITMIKCPDPWWSSKGWFQIVDAHRAAMDLDDDLNGWITLADLRRWLHIFDKDDDGSISKREYNGFNSERYGVNSSLASAMFDLSDINGDDKLDEHDWEFHFQGGFSLSFCDARRSILDLARMAEQFRGIKQGGELRDSMQQRLQEEWSWYLQNRQQRPPSSRLMQSFHGGDAAKGNIDLCGSRVTCYVGEYTEDWGQPNAWLWWGMKDNARRVNGAPSRFGGQVGGTLRPGGLSNGVGGASNQYEPFVNPVNQIGGATRLIGGVPNLAMGASGPMFDQPPWVDIVSMGPVVGLAPYLRFRRAIANGLDQLQQEKSHQENEYFSTYHRLFSPFTEPVPTETSIKPGNELTRQQSLPTQPHHKHNQASVNSETSSPDQTDLKTLETPRIRTESSTNDEPTPKSGAESSNEDESQQLSPDWLSSQLPFLGYPVVVGFDPWMFGGIPNWGMFGRKKREGELAEDHRSEETLGQDVVYDDNVNFNETGNRTVENDDFEYWRLMMPPPPGFGMLPWDFWMALTLENAMWDTMHLLSELSDVNSSYVANETDTTGSQLAWGEQVELRETVNNPDVIGGTTEDKDVHDRQRRSSNGNAKEEPDNDTLTVSESNEGRDRRFVPTLGGLQSLYWPLILNRWRRQFVPIVARYWPPLNPNLNDYKTWDARSSINSYSNPWSSASWDHNPLAGTAGNWDPWGSVFSNIRLKRNAKDTDKESVDTEGDRELRSNEGDASRRESFQGDSSSSDDVPDSVWRSASKKNADKEEWEQQINAGSSQWNVGTNDRPGYTTNRWPNENLPTSARPTEPGWWRNILSGTGKNWNNVYPGSFHNPWETHYGRQNTVGNGDSLRQALWGNVIPRTLFSSLMTPGPGWSDWGYNFGSGMGYDGREVGPYGDWDQWSDFPLWPDQWQDSFQENPGRWLSLRDTFTNVRDLDDLWKTWYGRFSRETNYTSSAEDELGTVSEGDRQEAGEKTDYDSEENARNRRWANYFSAEDNPAVSLNSMSKWASWYLLPRCQDYWSSARFARSVAESRDVNSQENAQHVDEPGDVNSQKSARNVVNSQETAQRVDESGDINSQKSARNVAESGDVNSQKSAQNVAESADVDSEKSTKRRSTSKEDKEKRWGEWNNGYADPKTNSMPAVWDVVCPLVLQSRLDYNMEDDQASTLWNVMYPYKQFRVKREAETDQGRDSRVDTSRGPRWEQWQDWNADDSDCVEWIFQMSAWSPWKGWNLLRSSRERGKPHSGSNNDQESDTVTRRQGDKNSRDVRCRVWYRKLRDNNRKGGEDHLSLSKENDYLGEQNERNFRKVDETDDPNAREKRYIPGGDRLKRQDQSRYLPLWMFPRMLPYANDHWREWTYPQRYQGSLPRFGPEMYSSSYQDRWSSPYDVVRGLRSSNDKGDETVEVPQRRERRGAEGSERKKRFWGDAPWLYGSNENSWSGNKDPWSLVAENYNSRLPLHSRFADYDKPWFGSSRWLRQERGGSRNSPEILEEKQTLEADSVGREKREAGQWPGYPRDESPGSESMQHWMGGYRQQSDPHFWKQYNWRIKRSPSNVDDKGREKRFALWDDLNQNPWNNWLQQFLHSSGNGSPSQWQGQDNYWRYLRDSSTDASNDFNGRQKRQTVDSGRLARQEGRSLFYNVPHRYPWDDYWRYGQMNDNNLGGLPTMYYPWWYTPFSLWGPMRFPRNPSSNQEGVRADKPKSEADKLSRSRRFGQYMSSSGPFGNSWGGAFDNRDSFPWKGAFDSRMFQSPNPWGKVNSQNRFIRGSDDPLPSVGRSRRGADEESRTKRWSEQQGLSQSSRSPWWQQYPLNARQSLDNSRHQWPLSGASYLEGRADSQIGHPWTESWQHDPLESSYSQNENPTAFPKIWGHFWGSPRFPKNSEEHEGSRTKRAAQTATRNKRWQFSSPLNSYNLMSPHKHENWRTKGGVGLENPQEDNWSNPLRYSRETRQGKQGKNIAKRWQGDEQFNQPVNVQWNPFDLFNSWNNQWESMKMWNTNQGSNTVYPREAVDKIIKINKRSSSIWGSDRPWQGIGSYPWEASPQWSRNSLSDSGWLNVPLFFGNHQRGGSWDALRYSRQGRRDESTGRVKRSLENSEWLKKWQENDTQPSMSSMPWGWSPHTRGTEEGSLDWVPKGDWDDEDIKDLSRYTGDSSRNEASGRHRWDMDKDERTKRWHGDDLYSPESWLGINPYGSAYSGDGEWAQNWQPSWSPWSERRTWDQIRFPREAYEKELSSKNKSEAGLHKPKRWVQSGNSPWFVGGSHPRWIPESQRSLWSTDQDSRPIFPPSASIWQNEDNSQWEWPRDGSPWRYPRETRDSLVDDKENQQNVKTEESTRDKRWQNWNPLSSWGSQGSGLWYGAPWYSPPASNMLFNNNRFFKRNSQEKSTNIAGEKDSNSVDEGRNKRWQSWNSFPVNYLDSNLAERNPFRFSGVFSGWNNPYRSTFMSNFGRDPIETYDADSMRANDRPKRSSKEDTRDKRWDFGNSFPNADLNYLAKGIEFLIMNRPPWSQRNQWWPDSQRTFRYRRNSDDKDKKVSEDTESDARTKRQNDWRNWLDGNWNRNSFYRRRSNWPFPYNAMFPPYPFMNFRSPYLGINSLWGWNMNQLPGNNGFWGRNGNQPSGFNGFLGTNWNQSPRINGFWGSNQSPWFNSFWNKNSNQLPEFNRLVYSNFDPSQSRNFRGTPSAHIERDKRSANGVPLEKRWDTLGMLERNNWSNYNINPKWSSTPGNLWNPYYFNSMFGQRSYRATEDENGNTAKLNQKRDVDNFLRAKRFRSQFWNYQNDPTVYLANAWAPEQAGFNMNNWFRPVSSWYMRSIVPQIQKSWSQPFLFGDLRGLRHIKGSDAKKTGDEVRQKRETTSENQRARRWPHWYGNPNGYARFGSGGDTYRPYLDFESSAGQNMHPSLGHLSPWSAGVEQSSYGSTRTSRGSDESDGQVRQTRETLSDGFQNRGYGNGMINDNPLQGRRNYVYPWLPDYRQLWNTNRQYIPGQQWRGNGLNQWDHRLTSSLSPRFKRSLFNTAQGDKREESTRGKHDTEDTNSERNKRWWRDNSKIMTPQNGGSLEWQRAELLRQWEQNTWYPQHTNQEWSNARNGVMFRRKRESGAEGPLKNKRWGQFDSSNKNRFSQFSWASPSANLWRSLTKNHEYMDQRFNSLQNPAYRDPSFSPLQNPAYRDPSLSPMQNPSYRDLSFIPLQNPTYNNPSFSPLQNPAYREQNPLPNPGSHRWNNFGSQDGPYRRGMSELSLRRRRQAGDLDMSKRTEYRQRYPWSHQNSGRQYPFGESEYQNGGRQYPFDGSHYQNGRRQYPFGGRQYPFGGSEHQNSGSQPWNQRYESAVQFLPNSWNPFTSYQNRFQHEVSGGGRNTALNSILRPFREVTDDNTHKTEQ